MLHTVKVRLDSVLWQEAFSWARIYFIKQLPVLCLHGWLLWLLGVSLSALSCVKKPVRTGIFVDTLGLPEKENKIK